MEMQGIFTLIVGLLCLTTSILRLKDYHIQDLIAFYLIGGIGLTTHFLDVPRFFIILFSLTFAFATTVHKKDDQRFHFLGILEAGSTAYTKVPQSLNLIKK